MVLYSFAVTANWPHKAFYYPQQLARPRPPDFRACSGAGRSLTSGRPAGRVETSFIILPRRRTLGCGGRRQLRNRPNFKVNHLRHWCTMSCRSRRLPSLGGEGRAGRQPRKHRGRAPAHQAGDDVLSSSARTERAIISSLAITSNGTKVGSKRS